MPAYPKDIAEKISALQAQIDELKSNAILQEIVPDKACKALAASIDHYYGDFSLRISWLSKSIIPDVFVETKTTPGARHPRYIRVKKTKELTEREVNIAHQCAEEIIAVLLKYYDIAREN